MMHDFRQSSEALRLSQVSKMLLQLSGQISAHCSSSEIRNTLHLCLFRVFFFSLKKSTLTENQEADVKSYSSGSHLEDGILLSAISL